MGDLKGGRILLDIFVSRIRCPKLLLYLTFVSDSIDVLFIELRVIHPETSFRTSFSLLSLEKRTLSSTQWT